LAGWERRVKKNKTPQHYRVKKIDGKKEREKGSFWVKNVRLQKE